MQRIWQERRKCGNMQERGAKEMSKASSQAETQRLKAGERRQAFALGRKSSTAFTHHFPQVPIIRNEGQREVSSPRDNEPSQEAGRQGERPRHPELFFT